ncbi:MAG: SAF domain-containing protein, partial [Pseudomonadota bacterium]
KSGIEMTAVCNAMDLHPQSNGLSFPPSSRFDVAEVCKPKADGGVLEKAGVTEVISSITREDTEVPHNLVMGTYVVIGSESSYSHTCFREYNCLPDSSGKYAALYRPTHMIGLELGLSVASAALRGEPTGAARVFNSDVVATAKRPLKSGEMLDGEGGFTVWGKQCPAKTSVSEGYLPLGLAHNVKLKSDIAEGTPVRWSDVDYDATADEVVTRRAMEAEFG